MGSIRRPVGIILIMFVLTFALVGCLAKEQTKTDGSEAGVQAGDQTGGSEQNGNELTSPAADGTAGGAAQGAGEQAAPTDNDPDGESVQKEESGLSMYDSLKEFNIKELTVRETEEGVKIHEIIYDACAADVKTSKTVSAYLVVPKGEGPFPAVIYAHWLGNVSSNKNEFLNDAIEMAERGAVGILIDQYFPWMERPNGTDKDLAFISYQVDELRRCIDFLGMLPFVDSKRIAYVGHDYGAMFGAIIAGTDDRIGSYNLVAGMGNFEDWFITYWVRNATEEYLAKLREMDPIMFIGEAAPSNLFFQFSNSDRYIDRQTADEFYAAASEPKEARFYDSDHRMNLDEIKADRIEWLCGQLGLE